MKILHITPHLGGGVGKAHMAMGGAFPRDVQRTFLLLEEPRDRRFADAVEAGGATVVVAANLVQVAELSDAADVVQFEFWNHPRLFECLARCEFPAMRSVFWSHVSGLSRPVIQPGLIEQAGRFVFTTEASRGIAMLARFTDTAHRKISVINSGFGFAHTVERRPLRERTPEICYLGTVDFIKMHPGFFDAIDRLKFGNRVCVWGHVDSPGAVAARVEAMRYPERIRLCGHTAAPAAALGQADIFFYPLRPNHYGTAENALVEAMSLGLVPVVLDNPAERAIVRDGETGFVARSIAECAQILDMLLASPDKLAAVSRNAARHIAQTRTRERSAAQFLELWRGLVEESKRVCDFRGVVGEDPAHWFLATQCLPGDSWRALEPSEAEFPTKGMLAHFQKVFPRDASLSRLANKLSGAAA